MGMYDELFAVARAFHETKIDYALCGGLALALHGLPRMTKDLDFLVKRKDVQRAKAALKAVGFTLEAAPMTFGHGTQRQSRVHRVSKPLGENLLMLDLIEVEPSWKEVWKNRRKMALEGAQIKTVSREGLAQMKRLAGREQDLVDIERLEAIENGDEI